MTSFTIHTVSDAAGRHDLHEEFTWSARANSPSRSTPVHWKDHFRPSPYSHVQKTHSACNISPVGTDVGQLNGANQK